MALSTSANQLKLLGYKFFYVPGQGVFVYRDGTSNAPGFERLRKETKETVEAAGLPVQTINEDQLRQVSQNGGLGGFGYAKGDVDTLAKLDEVTSKALDAIKTALSRTPDDGTTIGVGNDSMSRAQAEAIVGDVAFSQAAQDEQARAGEAEAARKDAEVAAAQQPQTQAERAGRVPTRIEERDGAFQVVDSRDGTVLETIPFGDNKDVARTEALARQNQISTGSTPQLSGRPDLFAIPPTQAEIDAGIQPIVPQDGMAPVEPQVASSGDIVGVQEGTLPTPAREEPSGLNPEEDAAADALAEAAANSDLIYKPQVSKEDIDQYVAQGIENAKIELDPYYTEIIGRAKEAYLQGVLFETQARELQLRQEELTRQQEKKTAVSDLEARGATFSGEAAELLGEESALPPELQSVVQGLLQKQQSLVASSTRQRFEQNMATLSQQAEELLGTQTVQQLTEQTGNVNPLTAGLFRLFKTSTPGSIAREKETQVQTRGRELAQADIARELAASPEFPTEKILDYI